MNKYALVDNGTVLNVILWDGEQRYETPYELVPLPEESMVGPGWAFDGEEWVAPVIGPDPEQVAAEEAEAEEQAAKQAVREAALAKLMALGLTEEEALAIAGG